MKRFAHLFLLVAAIFLASCHKEVKPLRTMYIEGTVAEVDPYGGLTTSFSPD